MMKNKFPFIFALLISTAFLTGCATNNSSTNSSSSSSASSQTTSVTSQQRVFTLTELAT